MRFWADLHIHSKYSIATSKDCDPENLAYWARRKGLTLIGTGDFTHPAWREELREKLEPAEDGLWRLKSEYKKVPVLSKGGSYTDACMNSGTEVRFVISGEISTIYKKNGKTRKVHHLMLLPGFEEADMLAGRLEKIGNIRADGRPILGLDSRHLLELVMETSARAIYIPAHIWTPHFSVFGANSGFDSLEECYEDLTGEIMALETGLSSDPAMNWRLSALNRYPLISNSDAHSPRNLAREANLFDLELSYDDLRSAFLEPQKKFIGTVEFFPEEGKYHWDGHRSCGVQWTPEQTKRAERVCPVCGRKVTVGVLHRVEVLADRREGYRPDSAKPYERLVSLSKVIASAEGVGEKTKKVEKIYDNLLSRCGPELMILREAPLEEVRNIAGTLTAEGIRRIRHGLLEIKPGFDGQYGEINIFREDERQAFLGQAALFEDTSLSGPARQVPSLGEMPAVTAESFVNGDDLKEEQDYDYDYDYSANINHQNERIVPVSSGKEESIELNSEQQEAVFSQAKSIVVLAGPGTGKTRTLIYRVKALLEQGAKPWEITCITFTKKAAEEMGKRLQRLLTPTRGGKKDAIDGNIQVGNFHQLCLKILRSCPEAEKRSLLSEYEAVAFLPKLKGVPAREMVLAISRMKNRDLGPNDLEVPEEWREPYREYQENLRRYGVMDFDELLVYTIELLEKRMVPSKVLKGFKHMLVDEFQDLSPLQYRLVKLLFGESLFVIGDPDQSIYGFRGAEAGIFQDFLRDFPGHEVFYLTQNYRSAPHILEAANNVISHNTRFKTVENKALLRGETGRIRILDNTGEKAEAIAVTREVIRLIGGTDMLSAHGAHSTRERNMKTHRPEIANYSFGDIVVLYRTGRQLETLEEALTKAGLPYKVVGEKRLLYDKKVRCCITFFHALIEPEDYLILSTLKLDFFGLGDSDIKKIWELYKESKSAGRTFLDFIIELLHEAKVTPSLTGEQLKNHHGREERETPHVIGPLISIIARACDSSFWNKLKDFLDDYRKYAAKIDDTPEAVIAEWIADRKWDKEGQVLGEFLGLAGLSTNLRELLNRLIMGREGDLERLGKKGPAPEYISLMTLHAAKGLEFPAVLITGVEEGLIPLKSDKGESGIEEERRLFYVGMTRAKRELVLFYAKRRKDYGAVEDRMKSRFIAEIPEELLSYEESATNRRRKHKQKELF